MSWIRVNVNTKTRHSNARSKVLLRPKGRQRRPLHRWPHPWGSCRHHLEISCLWRVESGCNCWKWGGCHDQKYDQICGETSDSICKMGDSRHPTQGIEPATSGICDMNGRSTNTEHLNGNWDVANKNGGFTYHGDETIQNQINGFTSKN